MDYNKKLQELISEAQKDGYDFIDGDSAKFKRKEEWLYVMEVFIFSKTCYEDSGEYHVFKDIYEIPKDIFLRMEDSSLGFGEKKKKDCTEKSLSYLFVEYYEKYPDLL